MSLNKKNIGLRFFILVGTVLLLLIVQVVALLPNVTTPIERVELSVRDLLMRVRGVQDVSDQIVIVAIDDASFNWTGYQWPWPRTYMAQIVDEINKGGAKVVGLDVFLFEKDSDPQGDKEFARALGDANSAVSVVQIFDDSAQNITTLRQPLTEYRQGFEGLGITSFSLDDDAIIRTVQAYDEYGGDLFYHWSYELARFYLDAPEPIIDPLASALDFNGQAIPLNNGQMIVNFAGPAGTFPTYPAYSVVLGDVLAQDPDAFRGKIVLIGATTVTLQDVYPTPFSAKTTTSGIEVVANAVNTIITSQFIREIPPFMVLLITILAAGLASVLSRSQNPTRTIVIMFMVMAIYAGVGLWVFISLRYIIPIVVPEVMIFLGVILPTLEQAVSQEIEKRRVRGLFTRFISPEMVDQLIATRDINSLNKRANVTVLFSDIRGFTTLSEKLSPEDVVAFLNPYLEAMTKIVHKNGGTVDKYEGDAIIAFFGEPVNYEDHAARAVRTAVEMLKELASLSERWMKEGRAVQKFDIGVGINSGEVFVGLVGSAQRINYTIIGDNANLAARLQDLTKKYVWPIIISESTYQQVKDEFETEFADSVVVKGKTEPVNIYKVTARIGTRKEKVQGWVPKE